MQNEIKCPKCGKKNIEDSGIKDLLFCIKCGEMFKQKKSDLK